MLSSFMKTFEQLSTTSTKLSQLLQRQISSSRSTFMVMIGLPNSPPVLFNFCFVSGPPRTHPLRWLSGIFFLWTRICLPKVHFLTNLSNATNEKICYQFWSGTRGRCTKWQPHQLPVTLPRELYINIGPNQASSKTQHTLQTIHTMCVCVQSWK